MRQRQADLDRRGVDVLAVTFEPVAAARAYAEDTRLPWPLLVDATRALYRAYGMGRGGAQAIWGLATWRAYGRLLWRGHRLRRSSGDVRQLGGDVLIDPAGVVRLHHVGTGPADRPSVESLLRALDAPGRPG